jgi:hypothetical protein
MTTIIGTSLAIATLGVFSYVSPYLAKDFMLGNMDAPEMITEIATGRPAIINIFGGSLYLLGTVLLGLAAWRSDLLPKWSGLLTAAHRFCLVFGFMFYLLLLASWIFLLAGGLWLFIKIGSESINAVEPIHKT